MSNSVAVAAKMPARPKRIASKRVRKLVALDARTAEFRRVAELVNTWTTAIRDAGGELSALRVERIRAAAQAVVLSETAKGRFLRNGSGKIADVVAAERHAAAMIGKIGLPKETSEVSKPVDAVATESAAPGRLSRLTDAELDAYESLMAEAEANEGRGP